ncbi:MAG TPA: serine hydrolase domain-containing protein [Polyangiaceae bacterium]
MKLAFLLLLAAGCNASSPSSAPSAAAAPDSGGGSPTPVGDDAGIASDDASPDGASQNDSSSGDPKFDAWAAVFDQERTSMNIPGCSVAVLDAGRIAYSRGFGTKGPGSTEPVDARTLYRIGSNTKALTAVALLRLVDEGKVSLDGRVTDYVAGLAITGTEIGSVTLRDLLTHQSGLSDDFVADASHDDSGLLAYFTGSQVTQDEYFMDPPGSFYDYSNPNFNLAGLVAEQVSGVSYRQMMHDRVLAPLGMTRTFFLPSEAIADGDVSEGLTDGSYQVPAGRVAVDAYDNAWSRPAGYAFSNVLDYARFLQFLYAGNTGVLSDGLRTAMQAPQVDTLDYGDVERYGFGVGNDVGFYLGNGYYATTLLSHGGLIPGYEANYFLLPAAGWGIIAFCNSDASFPDTSFAEALQDLAPLPSPSAPPDVAPIPSTFAAMAGAYYDPYTVGHVSIAATSAGLTISMPDVDAAGVTYDHALAPTTRDGFDFTFDGADTEVTFMKDSSGTYVWMRTRGFVAKRS